MKEMTTAEFAKANLAALDEPVRIRRYTTTVGTYYPQGYEPAAGPDLEPQTLFGYDEVLGASTKRIEELEEEVGRLKKELAKRPAVAVTAGGSTEALLKASMTSRSDDPFAGLAKQDREFFERKLGKKK